MSIKNKAAQPAPPADRISKAVEAASPSATPQQSTSNKRLAGPFQVNHELKSYGPLYWTETGERGTPGIMRVAITDTTPHCNILGEVLPEFADEIVKALNFEAQSSRSEAQPTGQPDDSVLRKLAHDAAERLCVLAKPKWKELPEWPGLFSIQDEIVKIAKEWAGRSASVPSENLAPYKELLRKICEILQSCDLESSYVLDAHRNGRTAKIKQELCDWLTEAASRVPALDQKSPEGSPTPEFPSPAPAAPQDGGSAPDKEK